MQLTKTPPVTDLMSRSLRDYTQIAVLDGRDFKWPAYRIHAEFICYALCVQ